MSYSSKIWFLKQNDNFSKESLWMGEQRTAMLCEVENQDFRIFGNMSYFLRKEIKQYSFDIDA